MSRRTTVWVALATVYTIWGSTYLGIALAVETMPPLFAVSSRFVAAGALLAAWVAWRNGIGTLGISRVELGSVTLIGLLLVGANSLLFYAERTVPIGLASLVIASVPLSPPRRVRRERPISAARRECEGAEQESWGKDAANPRGESRQALNPVWRQLTASRAS